LTARRRAEVGDEVLHEDYGRGMVVEVRPRAFFDILEVAFADGVRRLNSSHPKILELWAPAAGITPDTKGARAKSVRSHATATQAAAKKAASAVSARVAPAPVAAKRSRKTAPGVAAETNGATPAHGAARAAGVAGADGAGGAGGGARSSARPAKVRAAPRGPVASPSVPVDAVPEETSSPASKDPAVAEGSVVPEPAFAFDDAEALHLDSSSVERLVTFTNPAADGGRGFLFGLLAGRLSLTRGFENLLALNSVHDLDRYEYQLQACFRVLRQLRGRALLADEVGLGKTIEAGLILKEYVLRGLVRRALVLTPVSLMSQWREELRHKFDLPFEVRTRGEGWGAHPFLIASIDTAKTERNRDEIGGADYDLLVVDEAHRLRNHLTQGWRFVDALSLKYLLLLTATPVQNDLRELYNLVTLLKPGMLGTYRNFRREFMVRGDKRLPKNPRGLAHVLSRVMIRTSRSSTSLVFPGREVRMVPFEMSRDERKLYDGVADFIRDVVAEGEPRDFPRWHFLLLVLQKEMGSSAPAAARTLERSQGVFAGTPFARRLHKLAVQARGIKTHAKVDGLLQLLREEADEKFLIFTQFRRTQDFLAAAMEREKITPALFHGSLSPADKDRAIEAFRGPRRVLLSTEAGGEGRNLQFCRTLVNFDLPWNPMRIEQRIGRIHRLGQTRDTRVYNFTTRDTVEDHVLEILDRKIRMFELVVGEMDMVLGQWSDREKFEHEVFRIWASHRDAKERRAAFETLGEQLVLARKRHERVKEFDDEIFSRLGPPAAPSGPGEES
jgi:superfamily II DNA or RNA helicase